MGKITNLLKTRFSTRKFSSEPIPQAVLDDLLEAGRLSPSGGNQRPWCLGITTNPILIAHRQSWMAQALPPQQLFLGVAA